MTKQLEQKGTTIVDEKKLSREIQRLLNERRQDPPYKQAEITKLWFEDGQWRVCVRPQPSVKSGKGVRYAEVLAQVEEAALRDFGVNVLLVPVGE